MTLKATTIATVALIACSTIVHGQDLVWIRDSTAVKNQTYYDFHGASGLAADEYTGGDNSGILAILATSVDYFDTLLTDGDYVLMGGEGEAGLNPDGQIIASIGGPQSIRFEHAGTHWHNWIQSNQSYFDCSYELASLTNTPSQTQANATLTYSFDADFYGVRAGGRFDVDIERVGDLYIEWTWDDPTPVVSGSLEYDPSLVVTRTGNKVTISFDIPFSISTGDTIRVQGLSTIFGAGPTYLNTEGIADAAWLLTINSTP
jgi:hypothetical protein